MDGPRSMAAALPVDLIYQIQTPTTWKRGLRPVLNRKSKFLELMAKKDNSWDDLLAVLILLWCGNYCHVCGERYQQKTREVPNQPRCRYDEKEVATRSFLKKMGRRQVDRYWNEYHCDGKIYGIRSALLEIKEWLDHQDLGSQISLDDISSLNFMMSHDDKLLFHDPSVDLTYHLPYDWLLHIKDNCSAELQHMMLTDDDYWD